MWVPETHEVLPLFHMMSNQYTLVFIDKPKSEFLLSDRFFGLSNALDVFLDFSLAAAIKE